MKIKFTFQILLWGISLITMTAPEALARHDQRVLDREISLDLRNVPLAAALSEIEMAADVKFAYSASQLDLDQPVTIEAHRKKLGLILNELLGPIAIMYTVDKDYILLKPVKAGIEKPVLIEKQAEVRHPFQAISGTVTDARTLQPIAGVNIVVKGTTSGTTTDSEGKYVIDAEEGDMLVFSFIGYKKIEVSVGGRVVIDVSLEEDVASLKEVVVNAGYYTVTDKAKTGNIVKVTSKEIERQPVTSPLMALQGRMPGVDITPVNGVPGSAVKIEIRGNNSLRFNGSNPLYVVDGVPLNSAPIYSAGMTSGNIDPLSTINPANIESIEVLKDGVATALYGSRGANGVVLITTKTGPDNTGETGLEISLYRGFGEMQNRVNLLNTEQYLAMRHEAIANDGAVPGLFDFDLNHWDTTRYTNWQDELLGGSAEIFDAQATLTGGSDRTSFRLGGSMHHENTIYPGDFGFKSYTANLSISHISADKRLNVSATVNYGANDNKLFSDTDFVNYAMTLSPVAPALLNDEDGQLNWEIVPLFGGSFLLNSWINPLSLLRRTHQLSSANLVANGVINYTLLPGLTFKTNLGFTEFNGSENVKSPIASFSPTITGITGRSIFGTNRRSTWILEPQATFSKNFGDHSIDAIIGSTFQQSNYLYQSIAGQGYTTDVLLNSIQGAATQTYSADDETEYKYQAIFARVGYDWKDKFFVDLIGRRDGSSRFGPGRQFGNFGAVGAGWIFTNEPFMKNVKAILSFGKLRGSLGVTGNDQIGDYQFYDTYSISIQKYQGQVNLYPTSLYNPDFRWEATHKREAAIELGFLNERISTELSWYRHRSSNQLVNYQLPATTGFSSITSNFDATIENSGWEITLNTENISTENFRWSTTFNISLPENKLVKFDGIEDSPYSTTYQVGEPLTIRRLYQWTGVDPVTGAHTFLDRNNDGAIISDDDMIFTNPFGRDYFGGINNIIRYKAFELSFLFQFSKQQTSKFLTGMPGTRALSQPVEILDHWKEEGDVTAVQAYSASAGSIYGRANRLLNFSNYNVQDGSFVRLKTLSASWRIPEEIVQKVKANDAQIYLQGHNLFTFSDFVGLDPETGSASLPPLRMIIAGIQLKF